MDKKYIFIDIDGTILDNFKKVVSDKTKFTIKKLLENGHEVFLCTGRNYPTAKFDLGIEVSGYVLSMGALVLKDGKILYDNPFPKELVYEILDYAKKYDVEINLETDCYCYANKTVLDVIENEFDNLTKKYWLPFERYQNEDVYKMLAVSKTQDKHDLFKNHFKDILQFQNTYKGLIYDEVQLHDNSKGFAIKKLAENNFIDLDHTICVGDSYNDISMFEVCNFKIAMGNGVEKLKEKADFITKSVTEDGLYFAFKKLHYLD